MANDTRTWIYILLARCDIDDAFDVHSVHATRVKAEQALEEEIEFRIDGSDMAHEEEEINFLIRQFPINPNS